MKRFVDSLALALVACFAGSDRGRQFAVRAAAQDPAAPQDHRRLLRAAPFDRITLIDGTVLIVDPVTPRPLPTYDPAKEREKRRRRDQKR